MRGVNPWASSARQSVLLAVQIVLAVTLCGFLIVLTERHNVRYDLTPLQSFILSDEARRIAAGVQVPVRMTVFYNSQEPGQRRQTEDSLQLFRDASPNISYRLVDLDRSPALAKKYGISSFNTGVIETDGETRQLNTIDEEEITKGLLQLTRSKPRTLCFIAGHGEHSPQDSGDRTGYSEVAKALEKENFVIRTSDAMHADTSGDCTVVLLPGPTRNLLPGEADELASYLEGGGHVLFMIDPDAPPSVVEFLARFGVRAGDDIVVDERNRFYGSDSFMPRIPIFDEGTFRKNLDTAAVFSLARTVSPTEKEGGDYNVLLIALSSPESWAHIDGGAVPDGKVQFRREVDKPGPLPVAVLVAGRREVPDAPTASTAPVKMGRMIVFGDSDFAGNLYLNLLGNKDLFMSSIGVLAEDDELISMRHKGLPRSSLSPVSLTARQGNLIFWNAVVVQPAGFAALGMLITWRRRRRGMA